MVHFWTNVESAIAKMSGDTGEVKREFELNDMQLVRLRQKYPFAHTVYVDGGDLNLVRDMIVDIVTKFPEAPRMPEVFYCARGNSVYLSSYLGRWHISGSYEGEGIAFAYTGERLYILHFEDNIFDVGVRLYKHAISKLRSLYETGEDQESVSMHKVVFRCVMESNKYVIRINGVKIMELSYEHIDRIMNVIETKLKTKDDDIAFHVSDLLSPASSKPEDLERVKFRM